MVTVVTEGIFSYCGLKLKIDTDRFVGPEQAAVRAQGEQVGHVTTAEYGSQMLALGGVRHLTGGSKKEGVVACETMLTLANKGAVELVIDGGARLTVQAGRAPIVNGAQEERMRVGCGSATIGIFAKQWQGHADEVIVVDDHITGVLDRASGRPLPGDAARRHPRARPQIDAGPLFPGGQSGARLGRHRRHRSPRHHRAHRSQDRLAGHAPAHGQHHRRGCRLFHPRRDASPGAPPRCPRPSRRRWRASARIASRR